MATVTVVNVPPSPPEKKIVIELTETEAKGLRDLLYSGVGGTTLKALELVNLMRALQREIGYVRSGPPFDGLAQRQDA